MPSERLQGLLDRQEISFETHSHSPAFTTQEVAARDHVSGYAMAKPVMLMADGKLAMVVVPAPYRVDLERAKAQLRADNIRFAEEDEFSPVFSDCEPGAEPPFGSLYDVPTYVDEALTEDEITFESGRHDETITIKREDYLSLETPQMVSVAIPAD